MEEKKPQHSKEQNTGGRVGTEHLSFLLNAINLSRNTIQFQEVALALAGAKLCHDSSFYELPVVPLICKYRMSTRQSARGATPCTLF